MIQEGLTSAALTSNRFRKHHALRPDACDLHITDFLSLLRLAGGVLASHDLVDCLSEAEVRGQPPGRLPQLLHAAVVCAGDHEGFGVFHCNQSTTWVNVSTASMTSDFLNHSAHPIK